MEVLNRLLSRVRELCEEFQIHKTAAAQVSLRATQAVALYVDELDGDDATACTGDLTSLFETFIHATENCTTLNPLDVVIRESTILDALQTLLEGIQDLLNRYSDQLTFNSRKWRTEWDKARIADALMVNKAALEVASSPHHMLLAQSLSDTQISGLCTLFAACSVHGSDDEKQTFDNSAAALQSPKIFTLVDMTGRIRILGDSPMVRGSISDFWLAGTSSGNLIAAKVLRGFGRSQLMKDSSLPLLREAKISSRFAHPNVLPTLGIAFIDDSLAILSPWMRNGNIMDYLERNPSADRLHMVRVTPHSGTGSDSLTFPFSQAWEISQGLAYLHTSGVIHGNLNQNAILVSEKGSAVISGFIFALPTEPEISSRGSIGIFDWSDVDPGTELHGYHPFARKTMDIRFLGSLLSRVLSKRMFIPLGGMSDDGEARVPTKFLPDDPLRKDIWALLRDCLRPVMGHQEPDVTASDVATRLGAMIVQRDKMMDSGLVTGPRKKWSISTSEQATAVTLPDLSAEVRKLGEYPATGGGFCDVYIGERLGKEKVALKILKMFGVPDQIRRRFIAEATIWSQLKHQNILDFYGICDHGHSISMVSPWMENSNIIYYVKEKCPDANRLKLLHDAAEGLLYLHTRSNPIVHGDLKCANILVKDDGTACLADFGLSKVHQEVTSSSLRESGSQRFMAPELFLSWENESEPAKTLASDCYAFGQVIVELLSGLRPLSELIQDHLVFVAIMKGHRAKRPNSEDASQWLTDPIWAFVQSRSWIIIRSGSSLI
ncbi:kinase-like protein [Clavulina sp. PMI_390]|nr:kinase-like protein [Clavulina sp. PMI_390]